MTVEVVLITEGDILFAALILLLTLLIGTALGLFLDRMVQRWERKR